MDESGKPLNIVNDSYQILKTMASEMGVTDKDKIQEMADSMFLINAEDDERVRKVLMNQNYTSAVCNGAKVTSYISVDVNLNN